MSRRRNDVGRSSVWGSETNPVPETFAEEEEERVAVVGAFLDRTTKPGD